MGKFSDLVNKAVEMQVAGHTFSVRQLPMSECVAAVQKGLAMIEGSSKGIELQDQAMECLTSGKVPLKAVELLFFEAAKRDEPELDAQDVLDLAATDLDGMMDVVAYVVQGDAGAGEDEKK
jgi:hypothetical protein